jgi:2-dehydropantoate 2-reductase
VHYGIIGIGPIGAVFAAHLAAAGHEVSVLCRNQHRAAYFRAHPIVVEGKLKAKALLSAVHTDLGEFLAGKPDVILICTKSTASEALLKSLGAYGVPQETALVACQNGIDVEEQITKVFGPGRASRIVLNIGCTFIGKSDVWVEFFFDDYLSDTPELHGVQARIAKDLNQAGITTHLTERYKAEAFKKAILNSMLSPVCALTHMTMSEVMHEPELLAIVRQIGREAILVAKAIGIDVGDDYLETAVAYLAKGGNHKPSMLLDIERRRPTENEHHLGALFCYAASRGLDVPVIQTNYYLLKNLEKTMILDTYVTGAIKEAIL